MMNRFSFLLALTLTLTLPSCGPEDTIEIPEQPQVQPMIKSGAPEFNADSAYAYVKKQVDFGPRVPLTASHANCANWLVEKLKSFGAEVKIHTGKVKAYDNKTIDLKNIIASFNPQLKKRILLAAHWDTRPMADRDTKDQNKPIEGANDGGSGVGVLLEVARLLQQKPLTTYGIDIIFFDMEDYGEVYCQGSEYWAKNPHIPQYNASYGILLDMVGAQGATFPIEGVSREKASHVVKKVWEKAARLGYANYFLFTEMQAITDDHVMVNQYTGIPCIDIIHMDPVTGDFFPHHHRHSDTMDKIDKLTLKAVGQTVLEVIYSER